MLIQLTKIEKWLLLTVFVIVACSVVISFVSPDFFINHVVVEDGLVEWLTVVGLLSCTGLALVRFASGRKHKRKGMYLAGLLFTAAVFTFGAGEEISWGQRLIGIESPEFFQNNNDQQETNLHNLVIGGTKINRLVFGKILAVVICSFAFLLPWMWSQSTKLQDLAATFAIPVPKLLHGLIYLGLFGIISCVDSGKRGELLEFSGSVIFFLMILNPINADVFRDPESNAESLEISTTETPQKMAA